MVYKRKTQDEYEIQGNHGQGWELETTELTRKAVKVQLQTYRQEAPSGQYRIVKKRVRIED